MQRVIDSWQEKKKRNPNETLHLLIELLESLAAGMDRLAPPPGPTRDLRLKLGALLRLVRDLEPDKGVALGEASASLVPCLRLLVRHLKRARWLDADVARDARLLVTQLTHAAKQVDGVAPPTQTLVRYSRAHLTSVFASLSSAFESLARARQVKFSADLEENVEAEVDVSRISTALLGLLLNAFRFTPRKGTVRCRLWSSAGEIHFSVLDSGPGIAADRLEEMFDEARLGDRSAAVTVNATGFSLGASRRHLRLHGGDLWMEARGDQGAAFHAWLPATAPRGVRHWEEEAVIPTEMAERIVREVREELQAEADLEKRPVNPADKPLVLLVEDSRSVQRVLVQYLETEFATASAFDGVEGLRMALELQPDLILIDISMPRMSGEELIRVLHRHSELTHVPLVVLTSRTSPSFTVELLESGVRDVLAKPFVVGEVVARVRNLVSLKRTRDVLEQLAQHHRSDLVQLAGDVSDHQHKLQRTLVEVEAGRLAAEAANRLKSNFLRMISHELRTPVATLQLQTRVLEVDPEIPDSPRLQQALGRIGRSGRKLIYLVDTVMAWARVESGRQRLNVSSVDVRALLLDVLEELRDFAEQKSVVLGAEIPRELHPLSTDSHLLRLVTLQLVLYALQVTVRGEVSIRADTRGEGLQVAVTDGGPPLSEEQRHRLFEALDPALDLSREGGTGSGIGLYVVRDIAQAIGGELEVVSANEGNTLTLSVLPVDPMPSPKG